MPKRIHPTTYKFCEMCNTKIERARRAGTKFLIGWGEYQNRRFCSLDCSRKYQSQAISGTKHYYWKGGKPRCLDCNKNLKSYSNKRCQKCWYKFNCGKNNANYKEHPSNYKYIHQVIIKQLGQPNTCKHCNKSGLKGKQINWANISGKYLRNSKDWIRLCISCHRQFDSH